MKTTMAVDRRAGYEAGEEWMATRATVPEMCELGAAFASGFFVVAVRERTFPSLTAALHGHLSGDRGIVDFSSSDWLGGFREAVIGEASEPG